MGSGGSGHRDRRFGPGIARRFGVGRQADATLDCRSPRSSVARPACRTAEATPAGQETRRRRPAAGLSGTERNLTSREDALRAHSASGAWTCAEEDRKGTLSAGKWADLAVLSGDYLTVPEDKISELSSVLTMVGGRVIHGEGRYADLAQAAAKAAPDWLPINAYPGYRKAERAGDGIRLAAPAVGEAMPTLQGADGRSWTIGCGCGVL